MTTIRLTAMVVCACCIILGCAARQVSLHSTTVEVLQQQEGGEIYVVDQVRHGDVFRASASFVWPEARGAGKHSYRWELFQDGVLVGSIKEKTIDFKSAPVKLWMVVDSTVLKPGACEFVLFLDGSETTRINATIVEHTSKDPGNE